MKLEDYQFFTNSLIRNLAKDPRVEGVVALGSMASQDIHPDRWSDHDFFVIVGSGHQELFRNNMDWLPSAAEILFSYRETTHGLRSCIEMATLWNLPCLTGVNWTWPKSTAIAS
jgi:hypothetical protein